MAEGDLPRRRFLTAGAATTAVLAGCTGGGGETTTTGGGMETTAAGGTETTDGGGMKTTDGGGMETPTPSEYIEPGNTGEEIHILTDYSNEAWQAVWEEDLVPAFEGDLGLNFEAEFTGFSGTGEQRLTTLIQAGNPPESFTAGITSVGDLLSQGQLAKTDHVTDYLVERSGDLVGTQYKYFGEGYVVPHGKYTGAWQYRTDILERLGLEIPETLDGILDNAKAIDEADEVEARGVIVPAQKTGKAETWMWTMLLGHGSHMFRWKDEGTMEEAEVWFPKEDVVPALEYARELAQYSVDPSSADWGSTLSFWAGGRAAMQYHLNAWPAGVAAQAGNTAVAENTTITPIPNREGREAFARGVPGFDGHPTLTIADNVPGWFTALRYMYGDPERAAKYYAAEPTRFIPAYADIMDTDAYRSAEIFREVPNLLDLNLYARDEIAPRGVSSETLAVTPATTYVRRFWIKAEMMNQVVVAGRDPEKAWEDAHERHEKRLAEGKKKYRENY